MTVYAPPSPPIALIDTNLLTPAGRWRRFCAMQLDMLMCVVVLYIVMLLVWASQTLYMIFVPLLYLSFAFYVFYMHGKRGQTIGKRLLKIRVVRTDGAAVGFGRSARRSIILVLESIPGMAAKMTVLSQIPASLYDRTEFKRMRDLEQQLTPAWDDAATIFVSVLFFAELFSWMLTKRRQTLSDLIADTVVVNVKKN